jgi:uncharacterized protein YbcI
MHGRLNQEIANAVVRSHKRFLGRGPQQAHAFFRGTIVVVVLRDMLSEAERLLVADGGHDAVLDIRHKLLETIRPDLVQAIERLTGCTVEAFMLANHIDPDLAAALFVLDRPVPGQEPTERYPP